MYWSKQHIKDSISVVSAQLYLPVVLHVPLAVLGVYQHDASLSVSVEA